MRAVVLLHGFLTSYHDFGDLTSYLKKEYDYVEEFIFPGHLGMGDIEPNYKDFTFEKTFEAVNEMASRLTSEYDIVDVIGFSMGGAVGTYLANKYPIHRLVLLAPANKFLNFTLPIKRLIYFVKAVINRGKKAEEAEVKEIDNEMGNVRIDDIRSVQMAFHDLIPNYSYHTLSTFIRITNECNRDLTKIVCPTLIIWGELDQLVPKKSIFEIRKICSSSDVRMVIYPDISHLMLRSNNKDKIISEILGFLEA